MNSLREVWNTTKSTNIHVIGVYGGERWGEKEYLKK